MSTNAFADSGVTVSNEFPSNDLMQANHVYKDSATFGHMGVYEGSVTATARYIDLQVTCDPGYYLPKGSETCALCLENNYCVGGTYTYSESSDDGIAACSNNLYAPAGMWEAAQCGRILHVGENVIYLRSAKKTTPSLNVDVDKDGVADFFGNMTTKDVPMHAGNTHRLKLRYNDTTYTVYDDTVNPNDYPD